MKEEATPPAHLRGMENVNSQIERACTLFVSLELPSILEGDRNDHD